jgi:hypothetical protein
MAGSEEQVRVVLSDYHDLQSQLSKTVSAISDDKISKAEVLHQLAAIQAKVNGFDLYLSSTVAARYYNERRSPESTVAKNVFHIPELLELILEHASIFDILNVYQTCRGLKEIVEASPKLQIQLLLRLIGELVDPLAYLQMHLLRANEWLDDQWFIMKIDWNPKSRITARFKSHRGDEALPQVGAVWKRMRICQPLLMSMRVVVECANCAVNRYYTEETPEVYFSTSKELTFRDLYDNATDILKSRECCAFCDWPQCPGSSVLFEAAYPW